MRKILAIGLLIIGVSAARADSADIVNLFSLHADPVTPVAAINADFDLQPGMAVRLSIYNTEETFLQEAAAKHQAIVDERGIALLPLAALEPGEYAFAAYLDVNGDGKLNRGKILGRPKEPIAFSNGAKAKLRKPRFDEAKVDVAPGSIVIITLDD